MGKTKKEQKVISHGTAKVFRYNAGVDSLVDGNSVQMAFLRDYKGEIQTAMEYIWYTKDGNNLIKRGIFVSGHGKYGVPTLKEYDIYVALQRIFINKKTKNGICELKTDSIDSDYLRISFTINELARELGYSTPSSATRENLKRSIEILLATTIFSRHEGGIYDIRNKKYITNTSKGFHLVEDMNNNEITDESGEVIFDTTNIRLSEFTYEQILNDYKLFYNKQVYNKTKNLMARKIYHMALQWKGNNNFAFANLNTLIERIPMIDVEDKYKKRDIKKALKILDDKGMVKIKYDNDNPNKVYFIFKDDIENNHVKKYNTYGEIEEAYYRMGFTFDEIGGYLDPQNIRHIQAVLRYMDTRIKTNSIDDIKEYFKKCLSNKDFKPDDIYYSYE